MTKFVDDVGAELAKIENQIDSILESQALLNQENKFLKVRLTEVSRAKAAALEKNLIAVQQIKKIIKRLKQEIA